MTRTVFAMAVVAPLMAVVSGASQAAPIAPLSGAASLALTLVSAWPACVPATGSRGRSARTASATAR